MAAILSHVLTLFAVMLLTLELRGLVYWRDNERDGISNNQPHDCLLNRLIRRRSKKTS